MAFFAVYDGHSTQVIAQLLTDKLDDYFFEEYKVSQDMDGSIKKGINQREKSISKANCSFLENRTGGNCTVRGS